MSTSDAKRLSGSPVLRSPEQEIALSAVICTYNRYDLLPEAIESHRTFPPTCSRLSSSTTRRIKLVPRDSDSAIQTCPIWAKELLHGHAAFDGRAGIVGGPIVPRWTDEKPAWIDEPSLSYLTVIDLGRELCELSAGEWLAGRNISFDMVSLIAAGGSPPRLGRMGSGSTLLSSEEIEASA
jgi:hypothetical protein